MEKTGFWKIQKNWKSLLIHEKNFRLEKFFFSLSLGCIRLLNVKSWKETEIKKIPQ